MRKAKQYAKIAKRTLRPEIEQCLECQSRLRRCMTMRRTIVTLNEVLQLIHHGYRCPDSQCVGHSRIYRSAQAEDLALPGFTFGLDVILLVGTLRLGHHQTLDEVHQVLLERLAPLQVISHGGKFSSSLKPTSPCCVLRQK